MKMFNSRRLIISGVFLLLVIVLLVLISLDIFTYSRYEKELTSQNSITTAVYLVDDDYDTITVRLPDVIPDNHQFHYSFSVSNYNDEKHSDTNLKYRVHVRTTTNLHINYDIFNSLDYEHAPSDVYDDDTIRDDYETYFRHIVTDYKTMLYTQDKTDYYTILFTFPDDYVKSKYSGIAELIEINIESQQILQSDT